MSASPADVVETEPDLRSVEAWSNHVENGREDPNVIVSWCGRFTVVRYRSDLIYQAFRRYPREQHRMAEPIGTAWDVASAVDHCVRRAAEEGA